MRNQIQVGTTYTISKSRLFDCKDADTLMDSIRMKVAQRLAWHIANQKEYFYMVENKGKDQMEIRARCIVLSDDDFTQLVEEIRVQERMHDPISKIGNIVDSKGNVN